MPKFKGVDVLVAPKADEVVPLPTNPVEPEPKFKPAAVEVFAPKFIAVGADVVATKLKPLCVVVAPKFKPAVGVVAPKVDGADVVAGVLNRFAVCFGDLASPAPLAKVKPDRGFAENGYWSLSKKYSLRIYLLVEGFVFRIKLLVVFGFEPKLKDMFI